ncbi:hypothetical protein OY671_008035, partial [Metschnikowia pulcherrima]
MSASIQLSAPLSAGTGSGPSFMMVPFCGEAGGARPIRVPPVVAMMANPIRKTTMSVEHAERTSVFADWTYYPESSARPVPRYTSYPTAAEFVDEDFEARQRAAIRAVRGTVSLYI